MTDELAAIQVVCNNPRHAGKIHKIETFRRYPAGDDAHLWRATHTGRHVSGRELYTCKLCGRTLVCNENTLQRLFDAIWSRRTELQSGGLLTPAPRSRTDIGAWRISLRTVRRTLDLLASNLPQ